ALVILGGIKRIGQISSWIVPLMAVVYVVGCLVILVRFAEAVPAALRLILHDAFTGTAAVGGFAGATFVLAVQKGVARGVFSNESGLGSAPIAAAAAKTREPAEQALVSMTGTFLDTIVVCSMTGLVLIVTGVWDSGQPVVALTRSAFETGLPGTAGGFIVTFGIVFFAYSTILGWAYYGEKCIEYLAGVRAVLPYRCLWVIAVAVGASIRLELVWNLADVMNGLMAAPNLIGLLGLSGVVVAETRRYLAGVRSSAAAGTSG
ncbi:sodium:alanine symporter family protein, partial [bacterium]|nr:sodium:alanine symporter family protein [bacterium]